MIETYIYNKDIDDFIENIKLKYLEDINIKNSCITK